MGQSFSLWQRAFVVPFFRPLSLMTNWKSKVVSLAVPIKIMCALTGAVSYCWQMNLSQWIFYDKARLIPLSWDLLRHYPMAALLIGSLMGYISAVILVLWCQQYYRTAHFIAVAVSSWCVGLGVVFIGLSLMGSNQPFLKTLLELTELFLQFGMPFFWGLILQVCARRLKRLPWRIET